MQNHLQLATFERADNRMPELDETKLSNDTRLAVPNEDTLTTFCSCGGNKCALHSNRVLSQHVNIMNEDWEQVRDLLPEEWKWDTEYHNGCWACTPVEADVPKNYPLTIAGAPVVLHVDYQWPPMGGVNPPPDPRPSAPIDCQKEVSDEVLRDMFLTFEGSIGFYILISGLLQVIVREDFDTLWASSHLPHKYGGLKVCYILQSLEPTMLPSKTETTETKETKTLFSSQISTMSNVFRPARSSNVSSNTALKLNDFIEARPKSNHKKERYSGRIGLKVTKDGEPYLLMSSHIITEAMLAKSHREAIFGRSRSRFEKLSKDWNDHVDIWAGNEMVRQIAFHLIMET